MIKYFGIDLDEEESFQGEISVAYNTKVGAVCVEIDRRIGNMGCRLILSGGSEPIEESLLWTQVKPQLPTEIRVSVVDNW